MIDWRETVRSYLRNEQVIASQFPIPRPQEPEPPVQADNGREGKRGEAVTQQHKDALIQWEDRKAAFVDQYLADSRKLRGFLERSQDRLTREQARAVEVLAELDAVLVAKLRRAELTEEMQRVTLHDAIGLLDLDLILQWNIDGEKQPVKAATVSGTGNSMDAGSESR